jgi:hypothetical protein
MEFPPPVFLWRALQALRVFFRVCPSDKRQATWAWSMEMGHGHGHGHGVEERKTKNKAQAERTTKQRTKGRSPLYHPAPDLMRATPIG